MADDLEILMQRTKQELARLAAEEKALKQKISALRMTEQEIAQSVAEGMEWLEKKKEYDAAKVSARQLVKWCDDHGI
jgi:hypothetical protein